MGTAVFSFGAVLVLISMLGGHFKALGAEVAGSVGRWARIGAGILGLILIITGVSMLTEVSFPGVSPTSGPEIATKQERPTVAVVPKNFSVTHVKWQGTSFVIVLVYPQYDLSAMGDNDKNALWAAASSCARSAGLAGTVVLASPSGYWFPRSAQTVKLLQTYSYMQIAQSINRTLTCTNF